MKNLIKKGLIVFGLTLFFSALFISSTYSSSRNDEQRLIGLYERASFVLDVIEGSNQRELENELRLIKNRLREILKNYQEDIFVPVRPAPKITILVNGSTDSTVVAYKGGMIDFEWSSSYADSCIAYGCYGSTTGTSDDFTVIFFSGEDGVFTVECEGRGGRTKKTVNIIGKEKTALECQLDILQARIASRNRSCRDASQTMSCMEETTYFAKNSCEVEELVKKGWLKTAESLTDPLIIEIDPSQGKHSDLITLYGENLYLGPTDGLQVEFLKNGIRVGAANIKSSGADGNIVRFEPANNISSGEYQVRVVNRKTGKKSNMVDFNLTGGEASGSLRCFSSSSDQITLSYSINSSNRPVTLFRVGEQIGTIFKIADTEIESWSRNSSYIGTVTDDGLNSGQSYEYVLRDGASHDSPQIAYVSCSTKK